jgi:hypothetical protein
MECRGAPAWAPFFFGVNLFTGTAGVSPASSNTFTQGAIESGNPGKVAFNESGRDARGPGEQIDLGKDPPLRENSCIVTIADSF